MQGMETELKSIVQRARIQFDPEALPGSRQYNTKAEQRFQKNQQRRGPERREYMVPRSWREDPGEKARRIWEWWRVILQSTNIKSKFAHFIDALLLVVLVQVSSAVAERVFSALKRVRDTCGDRLVQSSLELRIFYLVNKMFEIFV